MKRIEQLIPLSKEHHQSLRLAKKCKDIAAQGSPAEKQAFSQQMKTDFDAQWDQHFQIEENTIFRMAETKDRDIANVCLQLQEEHNIMRKMVEKIAAGDTDLLHEFGQLLHDHTRLEEKVLFPMVEEKFSREELENILKLSDQ